MRKAKRHLNLPADLITPEQKLEEISLFEDDKYNFLPLTNRCTKCFIKKLRSMDGSTMIISMSPGMS